MEALRIVAMSMILIHHFLVHSITEDNIYGNLFPVLNCLVYAGVDIFFFVSGYFSIKLSIRRIVRFLIMIAFFVAVNILLLKFLGVDGTLQRTISQIIFPINGYWFIQKYFLLMLTAPIINAGLKSLSSHTLIKCVIILLAGVVYIHSGVASHTYLNALLLYVLGWTSNRIKLAELLSPFKWFMMFVTITFTMMGIQMLALKILGHTISCFFNYDNLFNIFAAVTISLAFAGLKFHSNIINRLAAASLGCYLLQDGTLGYKWTYEFQHEFFINHSNLLEVSGFFAAFFILYWGISWALTSFVNIWIGQLSTYISNYIHKILGSLYKII